MKLGLVLSEAARSLRASMSTTVAATLTVLVGMFVLGLTIAFGTWVLSWSDQVKQQLVVKVFFQQGVSGKQVDAVRIKLDKDPRVKSIAYVSPAEGLARVKKLYPVYAKVPLAYNPLGPAYTVYPKNAEFVEPIAKSLAPLPAGVRNVTYGKKTAHTILRFARAIEITFLVGVVVLLIASMLLIGNTIRLSIFARRREIEVMKLVGATNWFVRGPFMLEGLICGLLGSISAILLLLAGKTMVLPQIDFIQIRGVHGLAFELDALAILAAGLLLGAAGSGLTLHRFLRI
jgi:cell division transport system permease protein